MAQMQRNYCVTKNNNIFTDFMFEEDAKELAETQQDADRAGHIWEAREMTISELGETNASLQ